MNNAERSSPVADPATLALVMRRSRFLLLKHKLGFFWFILAIEAT